MPESDAAPAFSAYQPAAWLRASGSDSAAFLQGQFTGDLRPFQVGQAVYGLWLTQKGKVLGDSFVISAAAQEFWIGSYFTPAAALLERLEAYIIADDIALCDQSAVVRGFAIFGVGVSELTRLVREFGGTFFRGRRVAGENFEYICPAERAADAQKSILEIAPRELSASDLETRRLEAGIPAVPLDLGPGELPQEGGLERDAVSFHKGCYLGQEVMARLHSMGQVRRRLRFIAGDGPAPSPRSALYIANRAVGEVRSVLPRTSGFLGIALISLVSGGGESAVSLVAGGPATVRLGDVL